MMVDGQTFLRRERWGKCQCWCEGLERRRPEGTVDTAWGARWERGPQARDTGPQHSRRRGGTDKRH